VKPAKSVSAALLFAAALALVGCLAVRSNHPPGKVAVWSTSADGIRKLERMPELVLGQASDEPGVVNVEPEQRYQEIVGFGAGMTDASAEALLGIKDVAAREELFAELFTSGRLNLSFLRLPIGASDFSREHYSLADLPPGQTGLQSFSMSKAAPQIAATLAARKYNSDLLLMASPWSAPAWMKTNDSLITGKLAPAHYADFAAYFDRYLAGMRKAGLPVRYVSVQNEPHFEPANYPGMRVDPASRAAFIGGYLGPLLARKHPGTAILDWDHNWDEAASPLTVLSDPAARRHIAGVAWHCYGGDVSTQSQVRDAHPDKDVFLTECSGGGWAPKWGETLGWMTENLIIGSSRHWSRGTLLWNLALNENDGPHKGGCGNCRGIVTIDSRSGAITRNVEYYVLGHAARFVRRGAFRIASNQTDSISNVAFSNPDGSLAMIAFNKSAQPGQLRVRQGAAGFNLTLPPGEVVTLVWTKI
jgi:glucosylceramidase